MRLDKFLFENKYYPSRTKASEGILRGEVFVNDKQIDKVSYNVSNDSKIEIKFSDKPFVSNGGYKLEKAFEDFNFSVKNLVCLDVGASFGGFTECLIRHDAKKVYSLDVGESLLSNELKNDKRIVVIDNFNARNLSSSTFNEKIDFICCDVSFISVLYLLRGFYDVLRENGECVILYKPQFECGKKELNSSGIVNSMRAKIEKGVEIYNFCLNLGLIPINFTNAPYKEGKNKEFLFLLSKSKNKPFDVKKISEIVLKK